MNSGSHKGRTIAAAKPDVVVRVRRSVVQVQSKHACIRTIVPVAAPDERCHDLCPVLKGL